MNGQTDIKLKFSQNTQHVFRLVLIVKGNERQTAEHEIARRLNDWFTADLSAVPPFADGSLLHWAIVK